MTLGADGVDGRRRLAWLDWRRHRGPEAKEAALVDSGRRHGSSVLKMATWPGCGGSPALAAPAGDAPGLSAEVASGAFGPGKDKVVWSYALRGSGGRHGSRMEGDCWQVGQPRRDGDADRWARRGSGFSK
jgi:hypothetical protein